MKKKILGRAVSLSAAAAICCTGLLGSAPIMPVSAEGTKASEVKTENISAEESKELVSVIVKLSEKPLLAVSEAKKLGAKFLMTDKAKELAVDLKSTQEYVQSRIQAFYPGLSAGFSYNTLFNGFSCEIPKNMINRIRSLPYVESVTENKTYQMPEMAEASGLGGYTSFYNSTGCSGEGQVIAVIDSELQLDHPMFAALDDSISVKLKKEDIAEIKETVGLTKDIDPERAYRSSKVPFAVDYLDPDPYDAVSISEKYPSTYHGTHVSGIAAGNKITDDNGKPISGIAKDAQLVFFAAGDEHGHIDNIAMLAALEDSVKLHADVVNMSFGSPMESFGEDPMMEAVKTAENAGITVCLSAGNSDDGSSLYDIVNTPDQPDVSTMANMAFQGSGILAVASANNFYKKTCHLFELGNEKILFASFVTSKSRAPQYLDDTLSGEYEYVYCGNGTEEELAKHDVSGKIVVADPSSIKTNDLSAYAKEAGAAGFIRILADGQTVAGGVVDSGLPVGFVLYEDGQKMIEAENKKIKFTGESVDVELPTEVSSFTSYGAKQSLELRPDIMGIGGYIMSADPNGKLSLMSGTSMSSPYLAGCSAVLNEYIAKKGVELEGADKLRYMRNLMMTSAVPYEEDGMYVTPRRQGAGLVSMDKLIEDKVLLTGDEGESKIQLYDKVGDTFSFDINLTNISSEDVDFSSAKLVLTTDAAAWNEKKNIEVIKGQQTLECTAELGSLLHTEGGEMRTETISVSLDSEQTAAIERSFVNGFYVEGYLLLEGADNCCDISVPVFGFHGDWAAVPIFKDDVTVASTIGKKDSFCEGVSFAEYASLIDKVLPLIPEEKLAEENADIIALINEYAPDELKQKLENMTFGEYYVSPNYDGLADNIVFQVSNARYCKLISFDVFKEDESVLTQNINGVVTEKNISIKVENNSLALLKDGSYKAKLSAVIDYDASREAPQTVGFDFKIDKTAPKLNASVREKNGRKILKITASDSVLDGVYIIGSKAGEAADPSVLDKLTLAQSIIKSPVVPLNEHSYITLGQPLIKKVLLGAQRQSEISGINFAEIIAAEPDENGSFTVEYDVTGLDSYTVTAMDKAYNMTDVKSNTIRRVKDTSTDIKVTPKFADKEDKTCTDITLTAGGKTFTADSTGMITITGLADRKYEAVVSKPGYAPRKVTITVGAANEGVTICKYGDCNGDGNIDFFDLGLMQRKICNWDVDYIYPETADTNGDGATDFMDLGTLQRYLCKWDITLGKAN